MHELSKIPRCNASGCGAEIGEWLEKSGTLDFRLSSEVCAQLDWQALPDRALRASFADRLSEMEQESWEQYGYQKHQLKSAALGLVNDLAESKSMRVGGRSLAEEKEAKQRHLKVANM